MKKIVLAQRKGGNHKTTASFNLAFTLALQKKKILLVDLDSQCNLTSLFNVEPYSLDTWKKLEILSVNKQIDLFPGTKSFERIKQEINDRFERRTYLKEEVFEKIEKRYSYDYIIIDTAPALDMLNINSFVSTDIVLIPIFPGKFSIAGLMELKDILSKVKQLNINLTYYIFLSGYHKNRNVSEKVKSNLETFQEYSKVVIPYREHVEKRILLNKPAIDLEEIHNAYIHLGELINGERK